MSIGRNFFFLFYVHLKKLAANERKVGKNAAKRII